MKNQMKKLFNILFICVLSGAFFHSCGLEEVYYLQSPYENESVVTLANNQEIGWFCSFRTNETGNSSLPSFLGTDVYYKIYNSANQLETDKNNIISYATSPTNPVESANYMIYKLNYQKLRKSYGNETFIAKTGTNRNVYFRIKTTKGMETQIGEKLWQFRACIYIDDSYSVNGSEYIYPMRVGGDKSFDFFDDDDDDNDKVRDVLPYYLTESDKDDDYTYSTSGFNNDIYYVQFFAVSVGMNEELAEFWSPAVNIGSIAVQKGK